MQQDPKSKRRNSLRNFFGYSKAEHERDPIEGIFFDEISSLADLKIGPSTTGTFIITGFKGSGKTALRLFVIKTTPHSLLLSVDRKYGFLKSYASDLGKYVPEFESVIINIVLSRLVKQLIAGHLKGERKLDKNSWNLIRQFALDLAKRFKAYLVPDQIKAPGFLEWDLEKLKKSNKGKFVRFTEEDYKPALLACLSEKPALILFDDIEDVFLGADRQNYHKFVEGLFRAATRINMAFENKIHFLVLIKYGLYRMFYDNPEDYAEVKDFVVELTWSEVELEKMLARRIGNRLGLGSDVSTDVAMSRVFKEDNGGSVEDILRYLFSMCSSGPRDVIDFCNSAITHRDGKPTVTMNMLRNSESVFSQNKLTQIHEDFGHTYPRLHQLIKIVFEGGTASYKREDFRSFVHANILGKRDLKKRFKDEDYMKNPTISDIIGILYSVGFLGYKRTSKAKPTYVIYDPRGVELVSASHYVIHPAYHRSLQILKRK